MTPPGVAADEPARRGRAPPARSPGGGGFLRRGRPAVSPGRAGGPPPGLGRLGQRGGTAWPLRRTRSVLAAGAVVRNLPPWLRGRVVSVRADGPADVILILRGGIQVRWGSPGHGAAKASEMAVLLRTRVAYYDVSDPPTAVTGRPVRAVGRPSD